MFLARWRRPIHHLAAGMLIGIFNVDAWRWRVSRGKLKHVKSQTTKRAKKNLKAERTKKSGRCLSGRMREPNRRDADKQRFCAQTSEPKDHYTSTTPTLPHTQQKTTPRQQQQKILNPGRTRPAVVRQKGARKQKSKKKQRESKEENKKIEDGSIKCHNCVKYRVLAGAVDVSTGRRRRQESAGPPRVPLDLRFHVRCDSSILQSAASVFEESPTPNKNPSQIK